MDNVAKKNKMDIVDIEKLYAQYEAGLSILKLSIIWNLPYASLHRAIRKVEEEKKRTGKVSS